MNGDAAFFLLDALRRGATYLAQCGDQVFGGLLTQLLRKR
jgi:hypothetical protein